MDPKPSYHLVTSNYLNRHPCPAVRQDDQTDASVMITSDGPKDWPDRLSRPVSPSERPQRNRRYPASPPSVEALETERVEFYRQNIDKLVWRGEPISDKQRVELTQAISSVDVRRFCEAAPGEDLSLPNAETLQYFLQLYFLHMHARYPVIHIPTFSVLKTSPLLLLAMILVGSTYSRLDRGRLGLDYFERTRLVMVLERERNIAFVSGL
jgi:hypothetical protein